MRKQKILVQLLVNSAKVEKHLMDISFLGLLTETSSNRGKKTTQTTAVTYSANQQKMAQNWGWVTVHTCPEPARQSLGNRKKKPTSLE